MIHPVRRAKMQLMRKVLRQATPVLDGRGLNQKTDVKSTAQFGGTDVRR